MEKNEIIVIDNNYFIVIGLLTNSYYELKFIYSNNIVLSKCDGYYSLGNYLKCNNKIKLPYDNTIIFDFNAGYTNIGDMTLDSSNNQMVITTKPYTINNKNKLSEQPSTIKLYYDNNKLYMIDKFVNIKIMDKLLYLGDNYEASIVEIVNIVDNIIYIDDKLPINIRGIYSFILPYQPFDILYTNIINNVIYSDEIKDNMIILINTH